MGEEGLIFEDVGEGLLLRALGDAHMEHVERKAGIDGSASVFHALAG